MAPLAAPKKFNPVPYANAQQVDPFSNQKLSVALKQEARRGAPVVAKEGRDGAARFAGGKGRGGDFNSI